MGYRRLQLSVFLLIGLCLSPVPPVLAEEDGLNDVKMPLLREALRDSDALAQAWFRIRAGDVAGARRDLQALVRSDPRNPDALHLYGIAAAAAGRQAASVRALKKSVRIRPDGWVGLHLTNLYLDAGRLRPAERLVRRLEESMGSNVQVRQARAFLLVAQGELLAARDRFQSLEADEASAAAAAQLAALHGELGEDDEAVVALLRAVERAPESSSYRRRYFEALVRANDWSTLAESAAEPEGQIVGGALHLYYGGLAALELRKRDRGIQLLQSLVSMPEAESVALAAAAALLYRTDAWDASEAASRAFLDREPEEAGLHHLLAMSLSRQQRESEALAHYRRAAELRRKDADLQFALFVSLCDLELVEELDDRMPRALREFREDLRFGKLAEQCLPQDDE